MLLFDVQIFRWNGTTMPMPSGNMQENDVRINEVADAL